MHVRTVYLLLNVVSTQIFPASIRKIFNKMCLMHDSSDICGAQFLYVSHSLHLTTLCTLALSSTSLFIAGPSEPPSLIIIAYILSDPSPPFQLAATEEESQ